MDKKDWTPEELELKEALNKLYESDTREPSEPLDLSFMNEPVKVASVKRRRRLAYIAAAVMLVFVSSFATAIFISNDYASAVQDKIQRKVFEMKHGIVVATDEEFAEEGETVWEITDFETAKKAKELVPELPIPGYVPEGYEFEKLTIHLLSNAEYSADYLYSDNNKVLCINSNSTHNKDLSGLNISEKSSNSYDQSIAFWSDPITDSNGATIISGNCFLQISSTPILSKNQIIRIIDNLIF